MMLFESLIFNLLPAAVGIMAVVLVFESCWRKCPPDKLMIVSGAGKMRSVSGKGTFVIPLLQRVDTLSLGAVQVQLTTENDIPTQDAILIHACAVANFQIGQTPELIETASKNYLNLDKEEMTSPTSASSCAPSMCRTSPTPRASSAPWAPIKRPRLKRKPSWRRSRRPRRSPSARTSST